MMVMVIRGKHKIYFAYDMCLKDYSRIKMFLCKKAIVALLVSTFLALWIILIYNKQDSERNFAIIPHFMLDSGKVDWFYSFIKNEYYNWWEPWRILLISPNHFHTHTKRIQTICESSNVNYKSTYINLSSKLNDLWIKCDKNWEIFSNWWGNLQTNEHGIWEHFQWINKYFPNSEILPIISPCFQISTIEDVLPILENLDWDILAIASVDFAHYQDEEQTLQHDEKSIETLKSMTLNQSEFIDWIDADCPVCLYLLQNLANKEWKKADLRYRDSSSTILNQNMWEENTSRIFMWYK